MSVPELNPDQKAYLVYEILQFAIANKKINERDSPKGDIFRLVRTIMTGVVPMGATSSETYIQELRKSGELWLKVRPFLRNTANTCKTAHCGHNPESHEEEGCTGNHMRWQWKEGFPTAASGAWSRNLEHGDWIYDPCLCKTFRTTATW